MKSLTIIFAGMIACSCFGAMCAFWTIVTLVRGEYLTAIVALSFSVFCFGIVVISATRWRTITPHGTFDTTGTIIRPDKSVQIIALTWEFSSVVGMGFFTVLYPLGKLDIPVPHVLRYYLPFMSAAITVVACLGIFQLVFNPQNGHVILTPDGFEFPRRKPSDCGRWEDVREVTDQVPTGTAAEQSTLVMVMSDGRTPKLTGASFTPGGWALRELVRFYWERPERRDELTDGRALDRLHNETFGLE